MLNVNRIGRTLCLVLAAVFALVAAKPVCAGEKKQLTLAVGLALAPYDIPESDSGLELDIVREALGTKGYTVKTKFVPFARVKRELMSKTVDGALTLTPACGIVAFYSDDHIVCENVVVSLADRPFKIRSVDDLKDKHVVAFQDATRYLGEAYARMAKQNPDYREIADQTLQINLLYTGRCDAIVLDKNIFEYHRKHNTRVDTTQPINIWHLFNPSPFKVAFIDKKVRDDFNEGLKTLRNSGRYKEIIQKYLSD
ncbi:MAG: transporter substrate-binding domain-containing protein [Deltaproteobacteria bacterium]